MKAVWNGVTIAESDETVVVEGNHYFPPKSVNLENLSEASRNTVCPWKGTASYYTIEAGGETNEAAAWFYPDPKSKVAEIKDYVAFWKGVEVTP